MKAASKEEKRRCRLIVAFIMMFSGNICWMLRHQRTQVSKNSIYGTLHKVLPQETFAKPFVANRIWSNVCLFINTERELSNADEIFKV
jgi:hypothetical protein